MNLLGLLLFLLYSNQSYSAKNTFAENGPGRVPIIGIDSIEAPYKWIGWLHSPMMTNCTASLIDEEHILTAAHCVTNSKTKSFVSGYYTIEFPGLYPMTINVDMTRVILDGNKVSTNDYADRSKDWAIIKLDTPIDSEYGSFQITTSKTHKLNTPIYSIAGYGESIIRNFTKLDKCKLKKDLGKYFYHSCDGIPGDSGAPIYHQENGVYYIDAVHVAAFHDKNNHWLKNVRYSDEAANMAVSSLAFGKYVMKNSAKTTISSYPYGIFHKEYEPGSKKSLCLIYCRPNEPHIGVTKMVWNSDTLISSQEQCQEKSILACAEREKNGL